jgi:hypothetical protein
MTRIALALACLVLTAAANAQGPKGSVEDPFLDNLVGRWDIERKMRGTVVHNSLDVEWVLQHHFVRLHMKDLADPPKYEAIVLIGFDPAAGRYVAHWTDNFGAQYSAIGYGKRSGDVVEFAFQYPDGPFYNTFTWNPGSRTWKMLLENGASDGKRSLFAEEVVRRADTSPPSAKADATCSSPKQHELDFWLGEWEVRDAGQLVATSRIERTAQGCVIRETYTQRDGYTGTSLSFHDPVLGKWRQTWVDSTGSVGEFSGELADGAMRFTGETHRADGARILRKMTLSPEGGKVRQVSEASRDGASWKPHYDFVYAAPKAGP